MVDLEAEVAEQAREPGLDLVLGVGAAHAGDGDQLGQLGDQHLAQPMERISRAIAD